MHAKRGKSIFVPMVRQETQTNVALLTTTSGIGFIKHAEIAAPV